MIDVRDDGDVAELFCHGAVGQKARSIARALRMRARNERGVRRIRRAQPFGIAVSTMSGMLNERDSVTSVASLKVASALT